MANISDSTKRFSSRVDFYVRSRPRYPKALLDFFKNELGFSVSSVVGDIGSGTGLLTKLLVENGNTTFAVEPNDEMRAAAESALSAFANFHSINGTAESTTLQNASVDLVVAGQAFHWFDPQKSRAEFQRILKPDGWVALIWNERSHDATSFNRDFHNLICRYEGAGKHSHGEESLNLFFGPAGYKTARFENPQQLNLEGLIDRLASMSYMPLPGDARYPKLMEEIQSLYAQHTQAGTITIAQQTHVYYNNLKS